MFNFGARYCRADFEIETRTAYFSFALRGGNCASTGFSRAKFGGDGIIPKSGHCLDIMRPHYNLRLKVEINSTVRNHGNDDVHRINRRYVLSSRLPPRPSRDMQATYALAVYCTRGETSSGISEGELCETLGIDRHDLSAYEQGAKRVSANSLLRVAKLLDVRPDYFFQGYTAEELSASLELFPQTLFVPACQGHWKSCANIPDVRRGP